MDNARAIGIEGKDYKVMDECTNEKQTSAGNSPTGIVSTSREILQENPEANNEDIIDKSALMECDQSLNDSEMTLNQSDIQKDMTDEDVMHHLDVIENIELDAETFGMDASMEKVIQSISCVTENEEEEEQKPDIKNIQILEYTNEAEPIEVKWYEKKIVEKEISVRRKFAKLGRVLGCTYPHYTMWLERAERIAGSPVCKLHPIQRCPLDKLHRNRWKFVCSKKVMQESSKDNNQDSSISKNNKIVWRLEPTGTYLVNMDNASEFPPFVFNAIKIFEDFLQTTINTTTSQIVPSNENQSNNMSMNIDSKKDIIKDEKQWLSLLVRSNSMDEVMLFATGKNINQKTWDCLKQIYDSGPGKYCNVKSLYCKSINKRDDKLVANTTFLAGAMTLDETVGTLKVQLAPRTDFWPNVSAAVNVVTAVKDLLKPTPKKTILEIGCGIGVIGLMLASKCRQVIGVDLPSGIEEAEIICKLNNINNASFIKGTAPDVVNKIKNAAWKNRVTSVIINTNTVMGRAIEVMTCLRKISSLQRIVMVTMLTKQSVRAILELARPSEDGLGHPFMPIEARVVDTLPTEPCFLAVILMECRLMHRFTQPWFLKILENEIKTSKNIKIEKITDSEESDNIDNQLEDDISEGTEFIKKSKSISAKKGLFTKNPLSLSTKNKLKLKRERSADTGMQTPGKVIQKFEKSGFKSRQHDVSVKKKNWFHDNRLNPLYIQKAQEKKEKIDLREKLSSNRLDADLIQKVNESREILEAAKQKLSGPSPTVDATTAKELKNVLSLVLEQTNKAQNQSRSVWDRIAPPETTQNTIQIKEELDDDDDDNDSLLKGRFVQETHAQDIVVTMPNKEFLETEETKPKPFKKYHNLAPLEPDAIMPVLKKPKIDKKPRISNNRNTQQNHRNSWNRDRDYGKKRWKNTGATRESVHLQTSSFKRDMSPMRKFSTKTPLLSPPRHPHSPPRRHFSPDRRLSPSFQSRNSQRRSTSPFEGTSTFDSRRQMTSPERPFSPSNRQMSPPRRLRSSSQRSLLDLSPIRQLSPPSRRQMTSTRTRCLPVSPMKRQMSSERQSISPSGRIMSSSRPRDTMSPRHPSPIRHSSTYRISPDCVASSSKWQQSPLRQRSPSPNYIDNWDIPTREQSEQSIWRRHSDEKPYENVWHNEQPPASNWQSNSDNERYHKSINQDKSWGIRNQPPYGNSLWQSSDNRWSETSRSPTTNNWDIHRRESLSNRQESWIDTENQRWEQANRNNSWRPGGQEDLPEDARDPWGDEGNVGLEERWMNQPGSSNWSRENWQNNSNTNINEPRWTPSNDMIKKIPSPSWQGGNNIGSWQQSNYDFQSQRSFNDVYRDRR